ncbi:MAG: SNF7 family protein [Candidatus Heimdallarchaeum aukensis]|uniref:SNF7 family protein n=1 Tax=Candidatus Heimdallarchaeum aukensis TaxID=2876573 RepID=A0A9Y1FK60_9ARCH|nr:MAG: SNF7 family protein [Candidatus Heimdallarchaeum aukensis]
MGMKNWLFGTKRKDDAEALATLKAQINRYEHESRNLERQADEQKSLAAKMLKSGNKAGAKQALKRRAIYMKRLNQVQNMLMNLQSQIDSIQTATSTVETVKAMELGTKVVKTKMQEVDVEKTERVMDEVMSQRDEIEMMTEALSDTALSESILDYEDDVAIDDQLAQLEAEMNLGKTEELPDLSDLPSTPSEKPTEKEEDTSDLEAELASLKKKLSDDK